MFLQLLFEGHAGTRALVVGDPGRMMIFYLGVAIQSHRVLDAAHVFQRAPPSHLRPPVYYNF